MNAVWKRQILLCKVLHYILIHHMKLELFKPDFHFFVIIDGLEPESPNVQCLTGRKHRNKQHHFDKDLKNMESKFHMQLQ